MTIIQKRIRIILASITFLLLAVIIIYWSISYFKNKESSDHQKESQIETFKYKSEY